MHTIRQSIRTAVLYISSVVVIAGVPMAAFGDKSPACVAAGQKNSNMVTDPATGLCVKKSSLKDKSTDTSASGTTSTDPSTSDPSTTASDPASSDPTSTDSTATAAADPSATTIDNSGNNSSTTDNTDNTAATDTSDTNNTNVTNGVQADTDSGNAGVAGNESDGSAGSGKADTTATVVNSVNSSDNANQGVATFTYDINGNVVGDITIDGTNAPVDANSTTDITNNKHVKNNTKLTNNIDVNSKSGNAKVRGNKSKGSATSGNANAIANITNLINTIIAANQSFVGTINIYGNLNGDILMSPQFIPQLIADNDGSVSSNSTTNITNTSTINDSASIINNINLAANSGNASVTGNQSSGSATTGTTQTNLTILNLTGHAVNAANSLLVFVNVLGTWVGMIVDAPGATAAALGSGVTENNTTNITNNSDIDNTSNITNNVNVGAESGSASVAGNESQGSATSGNATASANIANFNTSTFNLTGWFGILYINVFGTWIGSFGINTAAGTVTPISGPAVQQQGGPFATAAAATASPAIRFGFVPGGTSSNQSQGTGVGIGAVGDDGPTSGIQQAARIAAAENTKPTLTMAAEPKVDAFTPIMMVGGFGVAGVSGAWTLIRRRQEMRQATAMSTAGLHI